MLRACRIWENEERHSRKESIILLLVSGMAPQRLQLTIESYINKPPRPYTRRLIYIRYYRPFGGNESARALPPAIMPRGRGEDSPKSQNHSTEAKIAIINETTESATKNRTMIYTHAEKSDTGEAGGRDPCHCGKFKFLEYESK